MTLTAGSAPSASGSSRAEHDRKEYAYGKEDPYRVPVTGRWGGLMTMSGLLMVLCGRVAIGGIFWAAAACMFFAARSFRIAEEKEKSEESNQNETTL